MSSILRVDTLQNINTSTIISQSNATTLTIGSTTNTVEISGTSGLVVPKGNTSQRQAVTGSFRFNTQTGYFEGYNGSSYTVIAPYPLITSISPTTISQGSLSTQNITIVGTSFENGATVAFIGNDATVYSSPTVTFNSSSSLIARINSSVTNANEPYVVKVTNPSSLYAESAEQININASPEFTTPAGSLGTLTDAARSATNLTPVVATDSEGTTITYTIFSGTIPGGLTFNSDGTWSGTASQVATQTTYSFVVQATDGVNNNTRSFSIIVQAPVITFLTAAGSLGTITDGTRSSYTLSSAAATVTSGSLTYSISSGAIPAGLSFNTTTAAITGTADQLSSDTTSSFTVLATCSEVAFSASRNFSITVLAPVATGGSVTTSGAYTYHTFASSGTFVVNKTYTMDYLIVAGGGSGGTGRGGAGGAGGYIATDSASIAPSSYTVTIGGGASGSGQDTPGNTGNPSSVFGVTANGGGYGGGWNSRSGGSGGSGGGPSGGGSPGSGTSGQGNDAGSTDGTTGGGGGGKGEAGNTDGQGYGGDGATWYDGITRGGGGGGGAPANTGLWGYGGDGGGTNGESSRGPSEAGAANTGGGTGGTEGPSGRSGTGGSGVVVIRYLS
jgi:hypothetical protein